MTLMFLALLLLDLWKSFMQIFRTTCINLKLSLMSSIDCCNQVSVEVSGSKTRAIFDDVFDKMVAAAQPIPGFRRVKGGKIFLMHCRISNEQNLILLGFREKNKTSHDRLNDLYSQYSG